MWHATQRNATQRNATQRNATQRNATQRNATQRNATQRNATQRNATQRNATQRNVTQRNAMTNDNDNICISVHLSQGMRINYVHVHYANFALIIVMNLTNFNHILTSRLLNSLCISNILGIFLKLFGIYSFRAGYSTFDHMFVLHCLVDILYWNVY